MSLPQPAPIVHESHLVSRHGPFCEKCTARRLALTIPCRIPDDAEDRAERSRRASLEVKVNG
jgi:hypothetical protein